MNSLSTQTAVGSLPEWLAMGIPSEAHPAAFEAYIHRDSRAMIFRLWMPQWRWRLVLPNGWCGWLRITDVDQATEAIFEEANRLCRTLEDEFSF